MTVGITRKQADELRREGVLATHIRAHAPGPFDPSTLSRSYALSVAKVSTIIKRHGGQIG